MIALFSSVPYSDVAVSFLFSFVCVVFCGCIKKTTIPVVPVADFDSSFVLIDSPEETETIELILRCQDNPCTSQDIDYGFQLQVKLYIDDIQTEDCIQSAQQLGLKWKKRGFVALCKNSALDKDHVPFSGVITSPPDARVSAIYNVRFRCVEGESTPQMGRIDEPVMIAGYEAFLQGQEFPPRITNTLSQDGQFAVVLGGHPHVLTEPMMRFFASRENTDVWLRTIGSIECGENISTIRLKFDSSNFPSQKVWLATADRSELIWTKEQGGFREIWRLPIVPNL